MMIKGLKQNLYIIHAFWMRGVGIMKDFYQKYPKICNSLSVPLSMIPIVFYSIAISGPYNPITKGFVALYMESRYQRLIEEIELHNTPAPVEKPRYEVVIDDVVREPQVRGLNGLRIG